jgi:hypothetical protein
MKKVRFYFYKRRLMSETLMQVTKAAMERNVEARALYQAHVATRYHPNQLVYVDESAADRRTTFRGRAWSIRGRRAVRKTFFVRGRRYALPFHPRLSMKSSLSRYSILPALSSRGILAVDIVEGSFDTCKFSKFIDNLLDQMNPWPLPNSVIVMDNCRIHKCQDVLDKIKQRYIFHHNVLRG